MKMGTVTQAANGASTFTCRSLRTCLFRKGSKPLQVSLFSAPVTLAYISLISATSFRLRATHTVTP